MNFNCIYEYILIGSFLLKDLLLHFENRNIFVYWMHTFYCLVMGGGGYKKMTKSRYAWLIIVRPLSHMYETTYYQSILDLENKKWYFVINKLTYSLKGSLFMDKFESCCVCVLEEET